MAIKLNAGHKHMLKLIDKDKKSDGWTVVSDRAYPQLFKVMPSELVEFSGSAGSAGSYKAKLTTEGQNILKAMAWL